MPATKTYWWTLAPFLRLLPLLMLGILCGWYLQLSITVIAVIGASALLCTFSYPFLSKGSKYRLRFLAGGSLLLLIWALGAWLVQKENIRNDSRWFGKSYKEGDGLIAALDEMPVSKPRSVKAIARITHLIQDGRMVSATGRIILYFDKEGNTENLVYGNRVLLQKPLQAIQNSGNPGAFDYRRFCLFQSITHQIFLKRNEYRSLPGHDGKGLQWALIRSRETIVGILQKHIQRPREQGLAEALLIGYKDDLDKGLVQAYSNTGVVHVIAISGLHLGLIYWLLVRIAGLLRRRGRVVRFLFIAGGLWAFTLLAGAQPSVVRSAVMFTCMTLGQLIGRQTSPLNTLAFSAAGLLCYNPFWLWDLGFQLSYTAVGGILIFYKPLYHLLYFPNKAVDWVWQLVAVTLTAQILTLPISLFHFHQFPVLFLITNLLAVPLSSGVLLLEMALCAFYWFTPLASAIGWLTEGLIRFLNDYIVRLSALPFALWDGFSFSVLQVLLLYAAIGSAGYWWLAKDKITLRYALAFLVLFAGLRSYNLWEASRLNRLIVYHVPRHRAADFISGRQVFFNGDTALLQDGFERAFHLRPARILFRAGAVQPVQGAAFRFAKKTIHFYDSAALFPNTAPAVLVVSGKAKLPRQINGLHPAQLVLDATVPPYRVQQWRRLADSLRWPLHDVRTSGAFVMQW
ncbi:ComEC/Rec2 family competence protein [Pseudocnuella soli]|uniref:ComEC/Rec2 family competence protein n=1 Tax=Pseudocnuella soli TaxID=2502779 RepID=UPI0010527F25|nr:ComEC/Rec2 family competence protein [Pseudocnuella soli]